MPIVDDPFDFGRIAATNALSDIYAMGGASAAGVGDRRHADQYAVARRIRDILRGGETVCEQAGIPIAGGHSIDSVEPIYGLAVTGVVDPRKVKRNSSALERRSAGSRQAARRRHFLRGFQEGSVGRGRLSRHDRNDHAAQSAGNAACESRRRARDDRCHRLRIAGPSARDVPGQRSWARASRPQAAVAARRAEALAHSGIATGASTATGCRMASRCGLHHIPSASRRAILTDPQTSGGLAGCVRPESNCPRCKRSSSVLDLLRPSVIGRMVAGSREIQIE